MGEKINGWEVTYTTQVEMELWWELTRVEKDGVGMDQGGNYLLPIITHNGPSITDYY